MKVEFKKFFLTVISYQSKLSMKEAVGLRTSLLIYILCLYSWVSFKKSDTFQLIGCMCFISFLKHFIDWKIIQFIALMKFEPIVNIVCRGENEFSICSSLGFSVSCQQSDWKIPLGCTFLHGTPPVELSLSQFSSFWLFLTKSFQHIASTLCIETNGF